VCEALAKAAQRAAAHAILPVALLGACDVQAAPSDGTSVEVFDGRTATWSTTTVESTQPGDEVHFDGHLYLAHHSGLVSQGSTDRDALADAEAVFTDTGGDVHEPLDANTWVWVLGTEQDPAHHLRLMDLPRQQSTRFAWGGRVYEVHGLGSSAQVVEVQPTGEVLTRVRAPHQRVATSVYDLMVTFATGEVDEISGTEEHPFWVPSTSTWVALSELTPGTVIQTESGGQAQVMELSERPHTHKQAAGVPVFNFEVAADRWPELHNYFVRGVDGDGPGVLVHNGCGQTSRGARREAMRQNNTPTSRPTTSQAGTEGRRKTVVAGSDGQPQVQPQHPADATHDKPHWHDGKPKMDDDGTMRTNRHGQVKDQSEGRSTSTYDEDP